MLISTYRFVNILLYLIPPRPNPAHVHTHTVSAQPFSIRTGGYPICTPQCRFPSVLAKMFCLQSGPTHRRFFCRVTERQMSFHNLLRCLVQGGP